MRDIPRGGDVRVEGVLTLPGEYGTILVHALQSVEYAPHDAWIPDPTPDDALAFRVVNAARAPQDYATEIRRQCPACRGY